MKSVLEIKGVKKINKKNIKNITGGNGPGPTPPCEVYTYFETASGITREVIVCHDVTPMVVR